MADRKKSSATASATPPFNSATPGRARPETLALADEWGRAARTETDHLKRAIAVAGHAACLAKIRRERSGG